MSFALIYSIYAWILTLTSFRTKKASFSDRLIQSNKRNTVLRSEDSNIQPT